MSCWSSDESLRCCWNPSERCWSYRVYSNSVLNSKTPPSSTSSISLSCQIETGRRTLTNSITRVQQTRNLEFVILSVIFEGSKHLEQGNQDVKSGHRFLRTCCDSAIFLGVFCGQRNQKTMGFNRFVGVQAQPYPNDNSLARTYSRWPSFPKPSNYAKPAENLGTISRNALSLVSLLMEADFPIFP